MLAPTTSSRVSASTVSRTIPLEKTSRWPRLDSQRGRNESSATKLVRNGKPLKLVLPPVNRIEIAPAWTRKYSTWPGAEGPEDELGLLGEHGREAAHVGDRVGDVRQP